MLVCLLCGLQLRAQQLSNLRQHFISVKTDTVTLDSMSIISGSFFIVEEGKSIDTTSYHINYAESKLIWRKKTAAYKELTKDSVTATYKVFPLFFTQKFSHKDQQQIQQRFYDNSNPYIYSPDNSDNDFFKMESLSHSGSISRGISFGNNQDVVVNSSLNLQLAGRLNKSWEISAAITDNNIPLQPDGNTQQLQDFDKVYIQLSNQQTKILAGDFELTRPNSYFMNFYKKGQGGIVSTAFNLDEKRKSEMKLTGSAAISKGKYARNVIQGVEANQGPYRLRGADNETFIVVLSGSEKVYVDGQLMQRGQEYDYTIDYNTAEVTFTANRLITKDKRITAEFQYSDKSYVRSLIYANDEYTADKFKVRFNFYSEQDSKNQPLLQDLTEADKKILANVGDSTQYAYQFNIDSIAFNTNEVLYKKADTIVNGTSYSNIFIYSTSPDSGYYRIGFSSVGINKGNYNQIISPVNGKVYQWVAPEGGLPQGSYEPVTLLIAPQKKQMLTLAGDYEFSKATKATIETAYSNQDVNLFSTKDKADNTGYAVNGKLFNTKSLSKAKPDSSWKLLSLLELEHVNKNFKPIELYRPIEFNRDWNLTNINPIGDENLIALNVGLTKQQLHFINYQLKSYTKGSDYQGFRNFLNGFSNYKKFRLLFEGSFMNSNATTSKSEYLKDKIDLSRNFKSFIVGVKHELEHNELKATDTDSLSPSSFYFQQFDAYIMNVETAQRIKYKLSAGRRYDYGVQRLSFDKASEADNVSADFSLEGKKSRLTFGSIYRSLRVMDTIAIKTPSANTLLNKIDYSLQLLNGGINFNIYYEAGTGQEVKKEYSYVEVAQGTGVYTWTDYNNDSVKQLNEFDIAAFADQANYIRVFVPTNEYIKTITNQLNHIFNFNPAAFLKQDTKTKKLISKFAEQFAVQFDNKTLQSDLLKAINPIVLDINDTNLISTNSSLRNTLFFNRTSSEFGADYTYQNLKNKLLVTNGFEVRSTNSNLFNVRWNITKVIGVTSAFEQGLKRSNSDYFGNRNYTIDYYRIEPNLSIQPNNVFRTIFSYSITDKKNTFGETGEHALQNKTSVEIKYSSIKRGIISGKFSYINISYNADLNSPLAYEMLEGLQKGVNLTWNFNLQRNLSKILQISVNYDGRKSKDVKTVHTAGVQARAFF